MRHDDLAALSRDALEQLPGHFVTISEVAQEGLVEINVRIAARALLPELGSGW